MHKSLFASNLLGLTRQIDRITLTRDTVDRVNSVCIERSLMEFTRAVTIRENSICAPVIICL